MANLWGKWLLLWRAPSKRQEKMSISWKTRKSAMAFICAETGRSIFLRLASLLAGPMGEQGRRTPLSDRRFRGEFRLRRGTAKREAHSVPPAIPFVVSNKTLWRRTERKERHCSIIRESRITGLLANVFNCTHKFDNQTQFNAWFFRFSGFQQRASPPWTPICLCCEPCTQPIQIVGKVAHPNLCPCQTDCSYEHIFCLLSLYTEDMLTPYSNLRLAPIAFVFPSCQLPASSAFRMNVFMIPSFLPPL